EPCTGYANSPSTGLRQKEWALYLGKVSPLQADGAMPDTNCFYSSLFSLPVARAQKRGFTSQKRERTTSPAPLLFGTTAAHVFSSSAATFVFGKVHVAPTLALPARGLAI